MAAKICVLAAALSSSPTNAARSLSATTATLTARTNARYELYMRNFDREHAQHVANITDHMSTVSALSILSRNTKVKPEMVTFLKKALVGQPWNEGAEKHIHVHGVLTARSPLPDKKAQLAAVETALSDHANDPAAPAAGYGGIDGAKTMLNNMLSETTTNLELEHERCSEFFQSQCSLMEVCRQDIAYANSQAAKHRARVLDAQATINDCEVNIPRLKQELFDQMLTCHEQLADLDVSLRIVLDDIAVMTRVLEMTDCKAASAMLLLECRNSTHTEAFTTFGHPELRQALTQLRSPQLKQLVLAGLKDLAKGQNHDVALLCKEGQPPYGLGEPNVTNFTNPPLPQVKIPGDPCKGITYDDGMGKGRCTISSNPNCYKLQGKFLNIQSGILDKKEELLSQIAALEESCANTKKTYEQEIHEKEEEQMHAQTKLADATNGENEAAETARMKGKEHKELEEEMWETREECSRNLRRFESEICSMKKIRTELYKVAGNVSFFQDCCVTEWEEQECSVSCGGGDLLMTRSINAQPEGGMACPPLRAFKPCNSQPCPIDCRLDVWQGWSACSANCNGGVRQRMRQIEVDAQYDGLPCGETTESMSCNLQACDVDCTLGDWTDWTTCSKVCDTGSSERHRAVKTAAVGDGACPDEHSPMRFQSRVCNAFGCRGLMCATKLDAVLLLDGSASMEEAGWNATLSFAQKFVTRFTGEMSDTMLSIILFSGPKTWSDFRQCVGTGSAGSGEVTETHQKEICGLNLVQHFTSDMSATQQSVSALSWPQGTTLTSAALRMAESELKLSRPDAEAVVLVVSDGLPLSPRMTSAAVADLKKIARIMWVPVDLPHEDVQAMREWSSFPPDENVITVGSYNLLTQDEVVDHIIGDMCPTAQFSRDDYLGQPGPPTVGYR